MGTTLATVEMAVGGSTRWTSSKNILPICKRSAWSMRLRSIIPSPPSRFRLIVDLMPQTLPQTREKSAAEVTCMCDQWMWFKSEGKQLCHLAVDRGMTRLLWFRRSVSSALNENTVHDENFPPMWCKRHSAWGNGLRCEAHEASEQFALAYGAGLQW
jgi:hypothetical protein